MQSETLSFQLNHQVLTETCRHFGLPVLASEVHLPPSAEQASLSELLQAIQPPLKTWGVARLEAAYQEDLYCRSDHPEEKALPRWEQAETPAERALQALLRQVRSFLGNRDWLIYWGPQADQSLCLLAVLPWGWEWPTSPWQVLQDLPLPAQLSPLSQTLLQEALDEWHDRLELERLESEQADYGWFECLAGKLVYNPETLLSETQWDRRTLLAQGLQALRWPLELKRTRQKIWDTFLIPHNDITGYLQQWHEILRLSLPLYLEIAHFLQPYLLWLEKQKVLNAFLQALPNQTQKFVQRLQILQEQIGRMTQNQQGDPPGIREILRYPEFKTRWQLFLSDFGHLSPGALDLSQARLQEQPEQLLRQLLSPWQEFKVSEDWQLKHWLCRPLWQMLSPLLVEQELLLSDALWTLDQIRQRLLELAGEGAARERLWSLLPSELERSDWSETWTQEGVKRQEWAQVWREQWLNSALFRPENPQSSDPICLGYGLGYGLAQGQLWWPPVHPLQMASPPPPEDFILVCTDLDLGWIPLLMRCQGVVLLRANPVGPSTLILRQLGIPGLLLNTIESLPAAGSLVRLNSDRGQLTLLTTTPV